MKHALIVGHPSPRSFCMSLARRYADVARELGDTVAFRDLYEIQFEPRLSDAEIPKPGGFTPAADVLREREFIHDADVFAFIYPLWFNAPPAIVTGYVQRVFAMGFGYSPPRGGGNQPLLAGRKLATFTSSGAPTEWLVKEGAWAAIQNLFDEHFANVCGLTIAEHLHFGDVTPGMRPDVAAAHFRSTEDAVRRLSQT